MLNRSGSISKTPSSGSSEAFQVLTHPKVSFVSTKPLVSFLVDSDELSP